MAEAIVNVRLDEEQMAVISGLSDRLARVERLLVLGADSIDRSNWPLGKAMVFVGLLDELQAVAR